MKKFNKVLAVALAVLMLMMTSVTAFADYALYIDESTTAYVEVPEGSYEEWTFEAERTGCYTVDTYIIDEDVYADPYVQVYDAYDNLIAVNDDFYGLESAVCFYAEKGETYYICFFDAADDEAVYEATIRESCGDYYNDNGYFDGLCDGCGYELCDHNCHNGGILGFFWSIANFFNRLFRINEYCDCGTWHW